MRGEASVEVEFLTDDHKVSTRLSRDQAVAWLRSQGFQGTTLADGATIAEEDLSDGQMASAVAVATMRQVERNEHMTIRELPFDVEAVVVLRTDRIIGIRATPESAGREPTDGGGLEMPFGPLPGGYQTH
jgi:hypothetical protein